jgi:TELO2-interacting protein 1
VPIRVLERSVDCIGILLRTGWNRQIAPQLGLQLFVLLNFLATGSDPRDKNVKTTEELRESAFQCIRSLWKTAANSAELKKGLLAESNVPSLGQSISTTLDTIVEGPSRNLQIAAIASLQDAVIAIEEPDVLSSFLPGIVSTMTKLVRPSSTRRPDIVVKTALEVLASILGFVLGSHQGRSSLDQARQSDAKQSHLDAKWLKATASQVKQALSIVVRVRQNGPLTTQKALLGLVKTVLLDCANVLDNCDEMMLDTLAVLSTTDIASDAESILKQILLQDGKYADTLNKELHDWVLTMPRIITSPDHLQRRILFQKVSIVYRILHALHYDTSLIDRLLASTLRDSLAISIRAVGDSSRAYLAHDSILSLNDIEIEQTALVDNSLLSTISSEDNRNGITSLLQIFVECGTVTSVLTAWIDDSKHSRGELQLASLWLGSKVIDQMRRYSVDLSLLFDMDAVSSAASPETLAEQLYELSVSILTDAETQESNGWQLQSTALDTICLQATAFGHEFRSELIDVLYPVIHYMGSPNPVVRQHAFTCLNTMAKACNYDHVSDMIVSNVDYLTNAVAIKLNTFDISPQAPLVLHMMVRLSGPSLLPYLDDIVASIFSALDNYHGYPKLVEALFRVLEAIGIEGVKTGPLAITMETDSRGNKDPAGLPCYLDVADRLCVLKEKSSEMSGLADDTLHQSNNLHSTSDSIKSTELESPDNKGSDSLEDVPIPAPKIYTLLLKIARFTQYYLTSSSPTLRVSLLSILKDVVPALAKHENSFLPLINTLWPVILARLDDPEAYVRAGALSVIRLLCLYGGDFMRSRIDDSWSLLLSLDPRAKGNRRKEVLHVRQSMLNDINERDSVSGAISKRRENKDLDTLSSYQDTPSRVVWNSLEQLLCTIVRHVHIDEAKFEDILDILRPLIATREDVRATLEEYNSDAVWWRLVGSFDDKLGYNKGCDNLEAHNSVLENSMWHFVRLNEI